MVPQRHVGAGTLQPLGNGVADALCPAGDHRIPAIEIDPIQAEPSPE